MQPSVHRRALAGVLFKTNNAMPRIIFYSLGCAIRSIRHRQNDFVIQTVERCVQFRLQERHVLFLVEQRNDNRDYAADLRLRS